MNRKPIFIISAVISTILLGLGLSQLDLFKAMFSGGSNTGAIGSVHLEYWGLKLPEQVMEPIIAEYEKANSGVEINYSEKKYEDDLYLYKRTLFNQLGTKEGPDIFRVHSTWMTEFVSKVSLTNDAISVADFRKRFYPIAYAQCGTTQQQIVCIPLMYDGLALLYNKDLFFAAGLNEPETWEDVRDTAKRLTIKKSGQIVQAGISLGTSENVDYSTDILGLMMTQSDVEIPADFDTSAASAALSFYTDFTGSDGVWDNSMPNSLDAFATQKSAMIIGTSSDILAALDINPTLNIGVLELPQIPNLEGKFTNDSWANFWVETVSSSASNKEQEAAWKFVEWMSQPEQQMKIFSEMSRYNKFGPIYSDKSLANNLEDDEYLGPIVTQAPFAKTSIISDKAGNDKYADIVKEAINKVIIGGRESVDPAGALEDAMDELNKLGLK